MCPAVVDIGEARKAWSSVRLTAMRRYELHRREAAT
jgi:hypothetical protein